MEHECAPTEAAANRRATDFTVLQPPGHSTGDNRSDTTLQADLDLPLMESQTATTNLTEVPGLETAVPRPASPSSKQPLPPTPAGKPPGAHEVDQKVLTSQAGAAGSAPSTDTTASASLQQALRRPKKAKKLAWSAALLTVLAACSMVLIFKDLRSPEFLREYGLVGSTTSAFKQHAHGHSAPAWAWLLRQMVLRNSESQNAASEAGAVDSAISMLQQNASSSFGLGQATVLLQELLRDNSPIKDAVLKQGGVTALVDLIKEDRNEALTAKAAQALALFSADNSASRKKGAMKAGAVGVLVDYIEGGSLAKSASYVNAAWALANLAADAPAVQAAILESGGPELFVKLLSHGSNQRLFQPAVYGIGNLAAKSTSGQEALRDLGALGALVQLLKAAVSSHESKASDFFHTEILEHVAELQKSNPDVRAALAEVGGLEELLGLMEAGSEAKPDRNNQDKQLMAVEEQDNREDVHSVRRLVRDLQDEVDSEAGILPEVKVPTLGRRPSGARVLHKLRTVNSQHLAGSAAWALGNLVANNPANQEAAREGGAVEALVRLLESADDEFVSKGALGAISSLVKGNPTNKAAIREANGVEGLIKLLASNPADPEVLRATARALKSMTAEQPAYKTFTRSSTRRLRVLGRQVSALLSEKLGIQVPPAVISAVGAAGGGSILLGAAAMAVSRTLKQSSSKGVVTQPTPEKKVA